MLTTIDTMWRCGCCDTWHQVLLTSDRLGTKHHFLLLHFISRDSADSCQAHQYVGFKTTSHPYLRNICKTEETDIMEQPPTSMNPPNLYCSRNNNDICTGWLVWLIYFAGYISCQKWIFLIECKTFKDDKLWSNILTPPSRQTNNIIISFEARQERCRRRPKWHLPKLECKNPAWGGRERESV